MRIQKGTSFFLWLAMLVSPVLFAFVFYSTFPLPAAAVFSGFWGTDDQRLLFVGDIMLARDVERHMSVYSPEYPFFGVRDLLKDNLVVANFEAAVPVSHEPTPAFSFAFSVDSQYLTALKKAGVDVVSLANNHSFDFGVAGFENAESKLGEVGIRSFGNQRSLGTEYIEYLAISGQTIALIGINLVNEDWSKREVEELFREASSYSDKQVVFVHWGEEYEVVHNSKQERYAVWFIESGADLVVGHHPHVIQDIAIYSGVPVFYSLGNFIFDQYFSDEVEEGLAIAVQLVGNDMSIELIPVTTAETHTQPQIMTRKEQEIFLEKLAERSDPTLSKMILRGILHI